MKTIVVSCYGGPSSGKSTMSHGIMHLLKCAGIDCEFSAEYAKDVIAEENLKKLQNQLYVFAKQHHRLNRLIGKTNVVITDAPLLHSIIYSQGDQTAFKNLVLDEYHRFDNLNFVIERNHKYNANMRLQDENGSNAIHGQIVSMLNENDIPFYTFASGDESLLKIVDVIKEKVNNN